MPPESLSIYRLSDYVPSPGYFDTDWRSRYRTGIGLRRNHWLTILFSAGKSGFEPGDEFPVWITSVDDAAEAIACLVQSKSTTYHPSGAYHLLGYVYYWDQFQQAAQIGETVSVHRQRLVDAVRPVIRIEPPLQQCIEQERTIHALDAMGFEYEYLDSQYWMQYGGHAWSSAL